MRAVRHTILKSTHVEFGDIRLKMILAVAWYHSNTAEIVRIAYDDVGLWLMDYRFVKVAEARHNSPRMNEVQIKSSKKTFASSLLASFNHASRWMRQHQPSFCFSQKNDVELEAFQAECGNIRGSLQGNGSILDGGQAAVSFSAEKSKKNA